MKENKYYMFRDLEHIDNLEDNRTFHAAGIVDIIYDKNTISGKDIVVTFLHPFSGDVISAWRATNEVELFEVDESLWKNMSNIFNIIENGK